MGKKLEAATNGRLSVQMYPSMQLGGEKETIEQTQIGAIQLLRVSVGALGPIVDDINVFNMPFLFRNTAHAAKDDRRADRPGTARQGHRQPQCRPGRAVLDGCRRAQPLQHQAADQIDRRPQGTEGPRHRQSDVRRHDECARRQRRRDGLRSGVQRAADRRDRRRREQPAELRLRQPLHGRQISLPDRAPDRSRDAGVLEEGLDTRCRPTTRR